MVKSLTRILCLGLVLLPLVGEIGTAQAQMMAPPPPPNEMMPPPPSGPPGMMVWQPGRWRWDGYRYVWVRGHYVRAPRPHVAWIPGHWANRGGGWVWIEGHWR